MTALLRLAVVAGLLALGCSCQRPPGPPPAPPGPLPEGACAAFCTLVERLDCPQAAPGPGDDEVLGTSDDVPCTRVCEIIMRSANLTASERCLDVAGTCDQAEVCLMGE